MDGGYRRMGILHHRILLALRVNLLRFAEIDPALAAIPLGRRQAHRRYRSSTSRTLRKRAFGVTGFARKSMLESSTPARMTESSV